MKKRNILFLIIIFIFFFTFVSGCTPSGENVPDEPPMSEDEKAAREVLDAIPVEGAAAAPAPTIAAAPAAAAAASATSFLAAFS